MVDTVEETFAAFQTLGLSEQKAKETLKNGNVTKILKMILKEVEGSNYSLPTGTLLYHLGTKIKPQIMEHLPYLTKYIIAQKLNSTLRVDKALEFILSHITNINDADFEKFCGVGVMVSPEDIERVVEKHLGAVKNELLDKRYRFNFGLIMQNVRADLEWADGKAVKNEIDVQVLDLLGPKTDADLAPVTKGDKKSVKQTKNNSMASVKNLETKNDTGLTIIDVMKKINFHKPGENFVTDGYVLTENTKKLMAEHLKITGGRIQTRFPPEPNGILHIGHAKAININFGYAAANNGICYLRYDDTNPEKEEEKFFIAIKDMVEWLGYKPYKITHSADYFDELYEWAVQLIKRNLAYVCHQSADEMKGFNPEPSKWRDRPIEESLQLFEDMKNGKIAEGAATLRMKTTLEEGKTDPVAYRVKFIPHHRTGDKWCIYPTYDYTHCLCDSIENITHSLCTKEFQSRRSSYYWLCNALNIYCPVQWEYGRLNVNYTVVSKRKIAKLITEKIVADWDDPRLFTLTALRRRGFTPEALSAFCAQLGVTGAQMTIDPTMLDAYVRDHLNAHAPRAMVVRDRLKVTLDNLSAAEENEVLMPNHPVDETMGKHAITFGKVIYIEKEDFQEIGDPGYRRLTKTQSVGLRHAGYVLNIVQIKKDTNGEILELICKCTDVNKVATKPKAFIHWVSDPIDVEIRIYELLFKHKNPEDATEVPGGFLSDCTSDSLKIYNGAADKSILSAKVYDKFQFERLGFFSIDPDTKKDKIVFNLTVGLKEAAGK